MLHAANQDRPHDALLHLQLEEHVRAMFHRVLASWATDALSLRRRGLDRPSIRQAGHLPIAPPPRACDWAETDYVEHPAIRWIAPTKPALARISEF